MTWNVFYYNFNTDRIEPYNVLSNQEDFIKQMKAKSASKEELAKELRSEMMYRYWSKAEWEVLISPWCGRPDAKEMKVDIFWQLELNWDRFVDYCWNWNGI